MENSCGLGNSQNLDEICTPKHTAPLVVCDMQVGVVRQIKDGPEIVGRVQTVMQVARAAGMRVFFRRHMSLPRELMGVFQLRTAMAWQCVKTVDAVHPWFLRDSPGFFLVPELTQFPAEAILDKITMSAFEGTPLNIALRDCGVNSFVIAGFAIEIGIEPTDTELIWVTSPS
jgi:nicotinamidase-related amidase